jgi:predicted enzyme related to lactoylglutathione lyase
MNDGIRIIYPVRDLAAAKAIYGRLFGTEPVMDAPYYVGFEVSGGHVGLDPQGHSRGMTGPVAYYPVDDIRASLKELLDAGAELLQEPTDVGGGGLIASVKDKDGNVIGLLGAA